MFKKYLPGHAHKAIFILVLALFNTGCFGQRLVEVKISPGIYEINGKKNKSPAAVIDELILLKADEVRVISCPAVSHLQIARFWDQLRVRKKMEVSLVHSNLACDI